MDVKVLKIASAECAASPAVLIQGGLVNGFLVVAWSDQQCCTEGSSKLDASDDKKGGHAGQESVGA